MEEDLSPILLVSRAEVVIKRDSWGHSYLIVGGVFGACQGKNKVCVMAIKPEA